MRCSRADLAQQVGNGWLKVSKTVDVLMQVTTLSISQVIAGASLEQPMASAG